MRARRNVIAEQAASRAAIRDAVVGYAALTGATTTVHADEFATFNRDGAPVTARITVTITPRNP
ncbi:MAG: hypothetical protein RR101_15220 [Burkholderiaceae bacterium]